MRMFCELKESEYIIIIITNNGKKSKEPIADTLKPTL